MIIKILVIILVLFLILFIYGLILHYFIYRENYIIKKLNGKVEKINKDEKKVHLGFYGIDYNFLNKSEKIMVSILKNRYNYELLERRFNIYNKK